MQRKHIFHHIASRAAAFAGLLIITVVSTPARAQWNGINLNDNIGVVEEAIARGGAGTQVIGQAFVNDATSYGYHAALWSGSPATGYSLIDLAPAGADWMSDAIGTTGTQQVGNALFGTANHAGLWHGSAASWVDLNPAGAASSNLVGFSGAQQVGSATFGAATHAGLWNGTAASWVDLNPAGATGSVAYGTAGTQQVGSVTVGSATHAALWSGTAASRLDLNPAGATSSVAKFITGTQQVGSATFGSNNHAGLWNGTAGSWVDLNPAGATSSQVNGTFGTQQVGQATFGSGTHAGLWSGTASSWVDLNPSGATTSVVNAVYGTTQVGYVDFGGWKEAGTWSGTAASWQPLPFPGNGEECCNWVQGGPTESLGVWTDGNYIFASGYATRWQYVVSVQHKNAIVWSRPVPLPGDFNNDGVVNAADYITWRKGLGVSYSQTAYDVWRAHFGETAGSGSVGGVNAAVPEPASADMALCAAYLLLAVSRSLLAADAGRHEIKCAPISD